MLCWLCGTETLTPTPRLAYFVWSDAVQALVPLAVRPVTKEKGLGRCNPPRP
jgi:hypothetical protein